MKKFLASFMSFSIVLTPVCVYAQEALTPKKVQVEGKDGVWLPADQMEKVLTEVEKSQKRQALIDAQNLLIDSQKKQISTSSATIALQDKLIKEETKRADDFAKVDEKLTSEEHSFLHSEGFWYGFGAFSAGLMFFLISRPRN